MSGRFELIAVQRGVSGHLRLSYGSGLEDPVLFALTLTPRYVARATGQADSVTFDEIEEFAEENAGDLSAMGLLEKSSGRLCLFLE